MSVATPFKYHRPLPWCDDDITFSFPGSYDVVTGLTLPQAMALWWTLENVTLTAAGSAQFENVAPRPPATNTLSFTELVTVSDAAALTGASGSFHQEGGALFFGVPRDRVCYEPGSTTVAPVVTLSSRGTEYRLDFQLYLKPDGGGTYSLYYIFLYQKSTTSGTPSGSIFFNNPSFSSTGTTVRTGTITVAGISLAWEARLFDFGNVTPVETSTLGLTASTTLYTF